MHKFFIFCSFLVVILSDPICGDGEFLEAYSGTLATKVCKPCPANCTTCTSSTACTGCLTTHFLYTNGGKTICELNASLPTGCAASTDQKACTACLTGYFMNTSKKCVATTFGVKCSKWKEADKETCETAASGYFLKDGTPTACSANCDTCTAADACTTCKTGFYLKADKTCKAVTATVLCKTWKNQDAEACDTCEAGFQAFGSVATKCYSDQCKCISKKGPYPDCNTACTDSNCLECPAAVGTCKVCDSGFFVKDNACTACSTDCKTCTSDTVCTVCNDGKQLYNNICKSIANCAKTTDGTACSTCSDGYIDVSGTCTDCAVTNCKTCSAVGTCTAAMATAYLASATSCPLCSTIGKANCVACSSASTCTGCADGFYLNNNACTACSTNCAKCAAETGKCTACTTGYFLDSQDSDNLKCVSCAQGEFKAYCKSTQWTKEHWDCQNLDGNCLTNEVTPITGAGETKQRCASCKAKYYLADDKKCTACSITSCDQCSKTQCLDCSAKFFFKSDLTACTACPTNCDRCEEAEKCLACSTGYSLTATSTCEKSTTAGTNTTSPTGGDGAYTISLASIFLLVLLFLW